MKSEENSDFVHQGNCLFYQIYKVDVFNGIIQSIFTCLLLDTYFLSTRNVIYCFICVSKLVVCFKFGNLKIVYPPAKLLH